MAWIQFCLIVFLLPWIVQLFDGTAPDECLRRNRFYCNSSRKCIRTRFVCNGDPNCAGGEDESPPVCSPDKCLQGGQFYCNNSRRCIRNSFVCNGDLDCQEGEDESPATCSPDKCHRMSKFYCKSSRKCIPTIFVCDGAADCAGAEDELPPACSPDKCLRGGQFYCNSSRKCIPTYFVCNGDPNCAGGEDESPPFCSLDKCRQLGGFYCNSSRRCILTANVCNGINNCKDGEDESPPACTVDECFRRDRALCSNDKCISTSWLCDGASTCPFGEDEFVWTCSLKHQCESNRSLNYGCLGRCNPGYFGNRCEKNCSEKCLNGICDKSSGLCKNCTRTYLESCSQKCGKECLEIYGFPQCDRQTGKCLNGCNLFHYGHYCNNTCKNCRGNSSNSPCDINGVCQFGCENDYWDKKCNSKCSANCQGDEHGRRCNSSTGGCINSCTRGWSGQFCGESTHKENVSSLKTTFIVIPVIATVVVVVVGIICCFWARKRFNRQLNERIEPRRVFRAPRQQPFRSRRRQCSALYADINEETMDHYHYICEQNRPDHYDKIKDRKPCICPPCVRERVDPILNRISSGSSSTTFVEPYATGGGSLRRSSIHSYISNRELNPRRSVTTNERVSGILPTKELTDDSYSRRSIIKFDSKNGLDSTVECKPRRSVSYSDGDLGRVGKTYNTNEVNPRPCGSKSKSSIELVCTHEYLDLEELYQKAKAEDKRKLAAKYFDEGEEVFGEIGQFQANYIHAIEREECEELNIELDHLNLGQNVESSVEIGQSEQIEESCFANDKDFSVEQQPAQSQNDENLDDPKDTDRRSDEIKQTDTLF